MSRRRLSAILTTTVLAVGALAVPAAAVELETVSTELPTETVTEAADSAVATLSRTVDEAPTPPTSSPAPSDALPTELVEDTVDEATDALPGDPTGTLPDEAPTGDDGTELAGPTSYTRTRAAGSGTRGAPAPEGTDVDAQEASPRVAPPRAPRFDRGALSRVPAAPSAIEAPEVAAPEVAAPRVAPAAAISDDVLAAPAGLPVGPAVPGALRAAAAALVLGASVTWRRAWDSLQA